MIDETQGGVKVEELDYWRNENEMERKYWNRNTRRAVKKGRKNGSGESRQIAEILEKVQKMLWKEKYYKGKLEREEREHLIKIHEIVKNRINIGEKSTHLTDSTNVWSTKSCTQCEYNIEKVIEKDEHRVDIEKDQSTLQKTFAYVKLLWTVLFDRK